jgi:hypothetical protein
MTQKGWQCPVCGYVYSPYTIDCWNCNRPDHEKTETTDKANNGKPLTTKLCTCPQGPSFHYYDLLGFRRCGACNGGI